MHRQCTFSFPTFLLFYVYSYTDACNVHVCLCMKYLFSSSDICFYYALFFFFSRNENKLIKHNSGRFFFLSVFLYLSTELCSLWAEFVLEILNLFSSVHIFLLRLYASFTEIFRQIKSKIVNRECKDEYEKWVNIFWYFVCFMLSAFFFIFRLVQSAGFCFLVNCVCAVLCVHCSMNRWLARRDIWLDLTNNEIRNVHAKMWNAIYDLSFEYVW